MLEIVFTSNRTAVIVLKEDEHLVPDVLMRTTKQLDSIEDAIAYAKTFVVDEIQIFTREGVTIVEC